MKYVIYQQRINMINDLLTCFPYLRREWSFNPLTAKLFNLNFHPLEVVSR